MPPTRGLAGIPRGPLGLSLLPLAKDSQQVAAQSSDWRGRLMAHSVVLTRDHVR
jgi:hypothetical protein